MSPRLMVQSDTPDGRRRTRPARNLEAEVRARTRNRQPNADLDVPPNVRYSGGKADMAWTCQYVR